MAGTEPLPLSLEDVEALAIVVPGLEDVELAEVVTDARATRAPKRLVKEHLG